MGAATMQPAVKIALLGDIILDAPDPDRWLSGVAKALKEADLVIGHLEVPHTKTQKEVAGDVPAPGAPPEHLEALARAGVDAVTLAGNHIADCGETGIADTIAKLEEVGIAYTGAGATINDARRPAILQTKGFRAALLSYNCVGPEFSWAGPGKAGCAYLRIEPEDGSTIAPAAQLSRITQDAVDTLKRDVADARKEAEFVIVALHKGLVHTPATLAPYERGIAAHCVEAGADLVIGHHAHIVQAIEFIGDTPVFHGLGNGCVVTEALSPDQNHPQRAAWARRRKELFGFEPDPAYRLAPFHPEAVNAMIGEVVWRPGERLQAGFIPVHVESPGRPVLAQGEQAEMVAAYIGRITSASGLPPLTMQFVDGRVNVR
ncbi:CapA family protein [Hyphococcus sp.]|uniref:CapA family protein n=1 Tax=Hyphococcus sp. TaxID=2038636 RepID=UPI0026B9575D